MREPPAVTPPCRALLAEALQLARRAQDLDRQVAQAMNVSRGRCATPAAALLQRYHADLDAWMARVEAHLEPGGAGS